LSASLRAHDDAALHAEVELPRVDDLAAVRTDGELGHLHCSRGWGDGDFRDANPVGRCCERRCIGRGPVTEALPVFARAVGCGEGSRLPSGGPWRWR